MVVAEYNIGLMFVDIGFPGFAFCIKSDRFLTA